MEKIKCQIEEIYEKKNITKTATQQRFRARALEDDNCTYFFTMFNNINLLNGFKANDEVEIEFNTKINTKRNAEGQEQTYTNHYVNRIRRINPTVAEPPAITTENAKPSAVQPPAISRPQVEQEDDDEDPF